MTPAQFLIDTSALARLMRPGAESFGWDQAVTAGLIAVCPITGLEFFIARAHWPIVSKASLTCGPCSAGSGFTTAPSAVPGTCKAN